MTPSFVSWFSGVGMFDLALIRAGFERLGACEIDKFARKVYAARLGAPAFFSEDITSVEAKDIPDADLWVGGFPCQDVSVAGKRAGIGDGDTRSGLVHTFLRLAVAKQPRFLLLENVPGLLSGTTDDGGSAGDVERDEMGEPAGDALWFGALLGALAESGYRHGAWRILDARWFGVAQRRRRVFLLFARDPRDGAVARAVLSEPESVRRGPPTRGEARPGTAAGTRGGLAGLGEQRVARALGSVGGGQDPAVGKGDLIVAHETGQGWWTEGAGTLRAGASGSNPTGHLVAHTLQAADGHHGRRSPRGDGGDNLIVAATINASYDRGAVGHNRDENLVPIPFDRAQITHPANRSRCEPGAPAPTLHAGGGAHVAFAPSSLNGGGADAPMSQRIWDGNGIAPTLDTSSPPVAFLDAWSVRGSLSPNQHPCKTDGLSDALDTTGPGAVYAIDSYRDVTDATNEPGPAAVAIRPAAVRRLTPMECELLMGLPPGHTCLCGVVPYSTAACKCADGPRYRAIGNGGAVPVVEWIGRRLLARLGGDLT